MLKKNFRYRFTNFVISIFLIVFAVICVYPIAYVIFASLSDPNEFIVHTGLLLRPLGFSLSAYKMTIAYKAIWIGYVNTILVVVSGVTLNMCLTTLAAYILSRKELYLHKIMNMFVIFTMYFSAGMIPTYMVVKSLGLVDSRFALILPVAINTWNLIILRTSMEGTPQALLEAAKIDGANEWTILTKVVVPLVKPTLAVLTLYYVVEHWNSWFNAFLYIRDRDLFPLQLVLREMLIGNSTGGAAASSAASSMGDREHARRLVKYCATALSTLPILCVYPFLQKYFINGVMVGAVKE